AKPLIVLLQESRALAVHVGGVLERHDFLEDADAAIDQLENSLPGVSRSERAENEGADFLFDRRRHLAIERIQIVEMAEHGAQADLGSHRDFLGAGGDRAASHQREHRIYDPAAVVLPALY